MRRTPVFSLIVALVSTTLALPASAAPPNDDIADSIPIAMGVEQRVTLTDATAETDETDCGSGLRSAWYSVALPGAGDYLAYTTGTDFDTTLAVSEAIDDEIACDDDVYLGTDSMVAHTAVAADDLFLQVDAYDEQEAGHVTVGVTPVVTVADDFADATPVEFAAGSETAVVGLAFGGVTRESGEPYRCGSFVDAGPWEDDLPTGWASFTPSSSGSWFIQAISDEDVSFNIYRGASLGGLELVNCAGDFDVTSGADLEVLGALVHLTAGTKYFVQITDLDEADPDVVLRAEPAAVRGGVAEVIDAAGSAYGGAIDTGDHSSMVTLPDGRPAVAYHDDSIGALRYAVRNVDGSWSSEIVDAVGYGDNSEDVGEYGDMVVLATGRPGIAYHDDWNQVLMFAEQNADGTWTTSVVDDESPDPGDENIDVDVLPDGTTVIAYADETTDDPQGELRFAERAEDGSWSHVLVDGSEDTLALRGSLVITADGRPIVAYDNYDTGEILVAERAANGTWSSSVVSEIGLGNTEDERSVAIAQLPDGSLLMASSDAGDRIRIARRVGTTWTEEDFDVDSNLARGFDAEYTTAPKLLVAEDGTAHFVFIDYENGSIGVATRTPAGVWTMRDMVGEVMDPQGGAYNGRLDIDAWTFGATLLQDGRVAATFEHADTDWLMYIEDSLVADPGGSHRVISGGSAVIDGSGSTDGWGDIVSYKWSVPAGCTFSSTSIVAPTATCTGLGSRAVSLTVTDTDGFTNTASGEINVVAPDCGDEADPFLDVAGDFYGRMDVNCIYNLGVTQGTSSSTYSPDMDVTRAQMASFLARLHRALTGTDDAAGSSGFVDIEGSPHADDIAYIASLGLTTGTSATTYSPDDLVTRGQMAAFLTRFYALVNGEEADIASTDFTDIASSPFADEIGMLLGLGVTTGTSATTFSPDEIVTRGQMASFLARTYRLF